MSLRRRVLLSSIVVAVVLLVADVALASTFRGFLLDRVDSQLATATERYARGPRGGGPGGPGRPPPSQPTTGQSTSSGDGFTEYFLAAADLDGTNVRATDSGYDDTRAKPLCPAPVVTAHAVGTGEPLRPFTTNAADGSTWRVAAVRSNNAVTLVGLSLADMNATFGQMRGVLVVATAAVLLTLLVAAFWVLRQGVRPLTAMTATAGTIAGGDLSERVEHIDPRTEAGRLGTALNAMMGTIESAFAARTASEDRLRRFAADASHELRTPLTSIRGYAELYRTGALSDSAALDDAMRRIEGNAARMGVLVEDLLLLARLDQGRPLDRTPVDLRALAEDAVADGLAVDPSRPIDLDAVPATVPGDEARLRQVVANLVGNALRHTPPGTPVHLHLATDGAQAVLTVADEGPGMDADTAAHVFERFYRADRARTHDGGGSGLGLSIVASVAHAHGGDVSVDSAPGAGARFVVTLPLSSPEEETDP